MSFLDPLISFGRYILILIIYLAGGGEKMWLLIKQLLPSRTTVHSGGRNSTMGGKPLIRQRHTGSSTHNQLFKPFSTLAQKSLYIKLLNSTAMEYD